MARLKVAGLYLVIGNTGKPFEVSAMSLADAITVAEDKCIGMFDIEVIHPPVVQA